MKSATSGTIAILNSNRSYLIAEYYTFTLTTGQVLRYTTADVDLAHPISGLVYSHVGPAIRRGSIKSEVGLVVAKCSITLGVNDSLTIGSVAWPAFAERGGLDGATVLIERTYMNFWGDLNHGVVVLFSGRVSDVQPTRTEIQLEVSSDVELLNLPMPRRLYQPGCMRSLFDAGCRVSLDDFRVSAVVGAGSTLTVLYIAAGATNLRYTAGFYNLGSVRFTSGANNGVLRSVSQYGNDPDNLFVRVIPALDVVPTAGDTFQLFPGCNKTMDDCTQKFDNIAQFGGFPYVPIPETAL